jgi:hypothetical protein
MIVQPKRTAQGSFLARFSLASTPIIAALIIARSLC